MSDDEDIDWDEADGEDVDWGQVDASQIVSESTPRPADTEPSIDSLERSRFQPATTINRVNSYELTRQEQEEAKELEQRYPNVYTKSGCPLCKNMMEDCDEFTNRMNGLLKDCSFHFPPHCVYQRISELHKTMVEDRMIFADVSRPFVSWHPLIVRNHFNHHTTVPSLVSNEMLDRQMSVFRALHEKCLARINPSEADEFDGLAIEDLKTLKAWCDLGARIDTQLKAISAGEVKKQIGGDISKFVKR